MCQMQTEPYCSDDYRMYNYKVCSNSSQIPESCMGLNFIENKIHSLDAQKVHVACRDLALPYSATELRINYFDVEILRVIIIGYSFSRSSGAVSRRYKVSCNCMYASEPLYLYRTLPAIFCFCTAMLNYHYKYSIQCFQRQRHQGVFVAHHLEIDIN